MSENKRRKIAKIKRLFDLLNYSSPESDKIDSDAVIKEVQRDPSAASVKYQFSNLDVPCYPLHQAVGLKQNIDVVDAIYKSYPPAIEELYQGGTVLHIALDVSATEEVVLFLISKWPEAAQKKDEFSRYPLHYACYYRVIYEEVFAIVNAWPGAVRERDIFGYTPLHVAFGGTPPPDIVSLLLEHYPDALKEDRDHEGRTLLHASCVPGVPFGMIQYLIIKYPEATVQKDMKGMTPLDTYNIDTNGENDDICQVLASVYLLYNEKQQLENDTLKDIIDFYIELEWWDGVLLLFNRYPTILKDLGIDYKLFPDIFSLLRQWCSMKTMWEVVRNELDIMEGI